MIIVTIFSNGVTVVIDLKMDEVVRMKKMHPCGGVEWSVVRLGADIRLRCLTCDRLVMMSRSALEKRIKI